METRSQTHPTPRQLAAFALGKLTPESRGWMKEHLADCEPCSTFLSQTPRDTLVTLLRQAAAGIPASEQSTPGVRDASTFSGLPRTEKTQVTSQASPSAAAVPDVSQAKPAATSAGRSTADEIPAALREQTKYRVIRLLGRGGMGSVYEAYHERMDRRVAIKVINPSLVDNPDALKRFDQEVRAAARLHHPNVALAYDADGFGSLRALVMEFIPGQSLDRYLAKHGALSVRQACDFMQQAAAGLNDAFKQGMVHRDLKPQNMMLTPEGKIKILDFGLAKLASERRKGEGLTREHALMGTAAYLAPEQALDAAKADVRADIYALGCTLYALLAGKPPFADDTEMKVLMAHQHDKHRPLVEVRPDVPRGLSELVDRMLAKDPAERPQTPAEVARALIPFVEGIVAPGQVAASVPASLAPAPKQSPRVMTVEVSTTEYRAPARPAPIPTTMLESAPRWWSHRVAQLPPTWRLPVSIALSLLLLLSAGWGAVVLLRTPTGTIRIEFVPADAEVRVDGATVTLARDGDELTIAAVPKGVHTIKLVRDGRTIWTNDVAIEFAGQEITASYSPFLAPAEIGGDHALKDAGPPAGAAPRDRQATWLPPTLDPLGSIARTKAKSSPNSVRNTSKPSSDSAAKFGRMIGIPDVAGKSLLDAPPKVAAGTPQEAQVLRGKWRRDGEELVQSSKSFPSWLVFGNPEWSTYDLSLKAKLVDGESGFKVFFQMDTMERAVERIGASDHCRFELGARKNTQYILAQTIAGNDAEDRKKSIPGRIDRDVWYDVKIEVRDDGYCCLLNGAPIFTGKWTDNGRGCIGLGAEHSVVRFKDILVTSLDGAAVLWTGIPILPDESLVLRPEAAAAAGGVLMANRKYPKADVESGVWKVDGEELMQSSADSDSRLLFGDITWSRYDFTFKVKTESEGNGFCAFVQSADPDTYAVLRINESAQRYEITSKFHGKPSMNWSRGLPLAKGRWHNVRIEVRGAEFRWVVDGETIFIPFIPKLSSGRVGFGSVGTKVRFRDVAVSTEDKKQLLWQGLPKLPE